MIKLTKAQQRTLKAKWDYSVAVQTKHKSYRSFRRTVQGTCFMDNAVVVEVGSYWLVIETDGYGHS